VKPVKTVEPVKPVEPVNAAESGRPGSETAAAGTSVPRQLARGALGFGLLAGSVALLPVAGPAALLAAPLALVAFRGCPTCWLAGLAQSVSRGRLERRCADGVCTLAGPHPPG
jgi:hypothetical protein